MNKALALACALALAACDTTSPETAAFNLQNISDTTRCQVTQVNGKPAAASDLFSEAPGRTVIALSCTYRQDLVTYPKVAYTFDFSTKKGHTYLLKTEPVAGGLNAWFETSEGKKVTPIQLGKPATI